MTTFHDGPAHGKTLMLHRKPILLRVVIDNAGEIDALDALDDEPKAEESIYLYVIEKDAGMIHINRGRGKGGFYGIADYRFYAEQPADEDMRKRAKWEAWVEANKSKFQPPEKL